MLTKAAVERRLKAAPGVARLLPAYLVLTILKHVIPLNRLVRWVWKEPLVGRDGDAERHVLTSVTRLRTWLCKGDDCLQGSLLLYRELSLLGADPTLAVGFRRYRDRLEGHAWVLVDGRAVPDESHEVEFEPAFQFGRGGVLVSQRAH
jgi:hypothetical protein